MIKVAARGLRDVYSHYIDCSKVTLRAVRSLSLHANLDVEYNYSSENVKRERERELFHLENFKDYLDRASRIYRTIYIDKYQNC